MIAPRTVASVLRTALYGSLSACFAISDVEAVKMVDAVVVGGILADYFTWLVRSLAQLPSHVLHGCYDTCINLLFGWFLFRIAHIQVSLDESSVVFGFLTFLLVMGIKVGYYSLAFVTDLGADDA
jgi:hypothetical protein